MSHLRLYPVLFLGLVVAVGCNKAQTAAPPAKTPEVEVCTPESAVLRDFEVFTGRTQAINYADLKCRVTGYLDKVNFKEGEDVYGPEYDSEGKIVKEGQPLFVLKLKPFEDALAKAKGTLTQSQAQQRLTSITYERTVRLVGPGGSSQEDVDNATAAKANAEGAYLTAQSSVDIAQQNLDWAVVRAPFSGRVGRRQVDPGNDVIADNTVLVTIVQVDPLYAYFDVDERTLLRLRRLLPDGRVPSDLNVVKDKFPVKLGLADELPEQFSHDGELKFADNKVDPATGTLRMWGTFKNTKHDLYPNLFIRVRMGIGTPKTKLFVTEAALGSDQGRKFLYVVDADNKVGRAYVEVGQRDHGLISVEKGLKGDERVVVSNLQSIRTKMEVVPKPLEKMPRVQPPPSAMPVVTTPESGDKGPKPSKLSSTP